MYFGFICRGLDSYAYLRIVFSQWLFIKRISKIMNLVQISNLFNQICLALNVAQPNTVGFYHYGYYSDINTNIQNNWTGANNVGSLYPKVQLLYPDGTIEIKEKSVKNNINLNLVFSDLQYYNNDSSYNARSIIEVQRDLETLAVNVLSEFNRIGRGSQYQIGITSPINIDYFSDAHNDSLVVIQVTFSIFYLNDCPLLTADISALPNNFNDVPPATNDLELL